MIKSLKVQVDNYHTKLEAIKPQPKDEVDLGNNEQLEKSVNR